MELAAAFAAVYGVAQYLGWDPLLSPELYTDHIPEALIRPPATFGQATYFAAFLLPGTLIAAAAVDAPARGWMHAVVFGLCTLAIILTGTRSAMLGLAVGGLIIGYTRVRFADNKRIFKYVATTFALVGLGIGLLALAPVGRSWRTRVSQWAQDPAGGTRLLVWRDSLGWFESTRSPALARQLSPVNSEEFNPWSCRASIPIITMKTHTTYSSEPRLRRASRALQCCSSLPARAGWRFQS